MLFIIENIILSLIAIFAILALASYKPSLSALFLLAESILINIYLSLARSFDSVFLGTSLLLSFFATVLIGNNFYFETSFKKRTTKPPKANIALGTFLIIIFYANIDKFSFAKLSDIPLRQFISELDNLTLMVSGFALFSMLVSALTIFDIKNFRSGNSI
jgi:hypothetical protein